MSRTFVDVGVRRIGDYITRVPKLAMIRGASAMVSDATDEDEIVRALDSAGMTEVIRNPDVGEADGVAHLEITGSYDPQEVSREVLTYMRGHLPGADLGASWGVGTDYASAFPGIRSRSDSGRGLEWFGATSECGWLNPCTLCGVRPALAAGPTAECDDCASRSQSARANRHAIARRLAPDTEFRATELGELTLRGHDAGPAGNHIALLTADGNGVGALFESLVGRPDVTAAERRNISLGLSDATTEAFRCGVAAVASGDTARMVPVLHGGDDLSVFLGADIAWRFAVAMLGAFQAEASAMVEQVVGAKVAATLPSVSMSAGLVFCKAKYPAADAFRVSSALMRHAKAEFSGQQAAVSWLDVTANGVPVGASPALGRPSAEVESLTAMADELSALAHLPASSRKRLQEIMDDIVDLHIDDADAETYLHKQGQRVGGAEELAPFSREDAVIDLRAALDLARWWQ